MYNLWEIRKRKGMSLKELSARTGIPQERLYAYEQGKEPIPYSDLPRLAKALYVEEWEIKTLSDPPPQRKPPSGGRPRGQGKRSKGPRRKGQRSRPRRMPPPPSPARETQLAHLRQLAPAVGKTVEELEQMVGKPLSELTRREASRLLFQLQEILRERKQQAKEEGAHNRKRAYLPEGVDRFELEYLTQLQESGELVHFHLFDGSEVVGTIVGFGPYAITVQTEDGETTLNKLAIAWYTRAGGNS
ncbi:MAG: helix-turn-helix domain-containing protein [Chloroflexi bacterium]|nr:helix-turn-helix domain-containing protein [Chloroflexota bacterium]